MIAYTTVGTNDLAKAVPFYKALLEDILGAKVFFESEGGVGWGVGPDKPMFTVLTPFDKNPRPSAMARWCRSRVRGPIR